MSEAAIATARRFRSEEHGAGRTQHWLIRIDGRQDCIGVVEPWSGGQFAAFSSGRLLGHFPTFDAAAEELVKLDEEEARR